MCPEPRIPKRGTSGVVLSALIFSSALISQRMLSMGFNGQAWILERVMILLRPGQACDQRKQSKDQSVHIHQSSSRQRSALIEGHGDPVRRQIDRVSLPAIEH